ncbi:hypothetical protein ACLHK8_05380 [Pediococcus sp. M21F004]|uniref:hypothetical protein n=1 Tax=Pediococcus sp. M21F004 TaxID=3390033 RepID=UPI003DA779A7
MPNASDNEVGFITLYFAKYLEEQADQFHVWIVCASGIGTSELLKVKIEKSFNNITVDKVFSSFDDELYLDQNTDVDLIISTVVLPRKIQSAKSILISALLNETDKKMINSALQKIR